MKNVRVAKSAGFCFGVKRAVDMVYAQLETNDETKDGIKDRFILTDRLFIMKKW